MTSNTAMDNYVLKDEDGVDYPIRARYFYLSSEFNETSSKMITNLFSSETPEDTLSPDNFGPFADDNDEYL